MDTAETVGMVVAEVAGGGCGSARPRSGRGAVYDRPRLGPPVPCPRRGAGGRSRRWRWSWWVRRSRPWAPWPRREGSVRARPFLIVDDHSRLLADGRFYGRENAGPARTCRDGLRRVPASI
ncbi:MAG: hypothetical protein ACRDOH_14835 [Streptosporangiaceae bacterium]